MRAVNRDRLGAARRVAVDRVVAVGRSARRQGFRFTSLQSCAEDDGAATTTCLVFFERADDGLEGSLYLVVERSDGAAARQVAVDSYASYGD